MFSSSGAGSTRVLPTVPRLDARTVGYLCGLFFLSRLLVLSVAALSRLVIEQGPGAMPGRTWIERFTLWDSGWYMGIVQNGYDFNPHGPSTVAFYPLYPMLIRAAVYCGMDLRVAGFAISHAALLAACVLLWKLAAWETRSASVADRAVSFLLFCPGAVWFGMVYTESLFLLTLLGCLLCARQSRWVAAGAWGLAAALTRTPGLLLAGFLFLEGVQQWWENRRAAAPAALTPAAVAPETAESRPASVMAEQWAPAGRRWWTRVAVAVAGPVLGHLSYLIFLQVRFGTWRAQQISMSVGWKGGAGLQLPWTALAYQWQTNDRATMYLSTALLAITMALALTGLFTLKRVSYAALVLTLGVLYVSATPGESLTRYLSTAATVYIVLAQMAERSRLLETAALVFSVGMMTLLTILLINGYHVV